MRWKRSDLLPLRQPPFSLWRRRQLQELQREFAHGEGNRRVHPPPAMPISRQPTARGQNCLSGMGSSWLQTSAAKAQPSAAADGRRRRELSAALPSQSSKRRHDPRAVVGHQRAQRERRTEIRHVGARHDRLASPCLRSQRPTKSASGAAGPATSHMPWRAHHEVTSASAWRPRRKATAASTGWRHGPRHRCRDPRSRRRTRRTGWRAGSCKPRPEFAISRSCASLARK